MSTGLRDGLLSYETLATSSSSDDRSPGTSVRARGNSPQQLAARRPILSQLRGQTYEAKSKDRIRIQVIEKSIERGARSSIERDVSSLRKARSSEDLQHQTHTAAVAPATSPSESDGEESRQSKPFIPPDDFKRRRSPQSSIKKTIARPSWARTRSGGVWYRMQRNTSSQDNSSIRSVKSYFGKPGRDEQTINISPLKPPPRPERPRTAPTYHIRVEKPFSGLQESNSSSDLSDRSSKSKRRGSSIDARRLFSAPFVLFKRGSQGKSPQRPSPSPMRSQASLLAPKPKDHRSGLKRNETAITLERVSTLLEGHVIHRAKGRLRAWTHKSVSTTSSSEPNESRQEQGKLHGGTFNTLKNKSLDDLAETTSSILDLRAGSTPKNSPREHATYKIKRSPSADTEEFLRIDISIRGETSYLPSEARRIHTPPLPEDGPIGLRRGFFFDYNAPDADIDCGSPSTDHHLSPDSAALKPISPRSAGNGKVSRSPSRKSTLPRHKTGDWFETQLADIDANSSDPELSKADYGTEKHHRCKNECQARIAEIKRQEYEVQLDYAIPEHLPSSPLCPRNPKYWRVVKQKGSQFRGCWIHGHGERDVVPSTKV